MCYLKPVLVGGYSNLQVNALHLFQYQLYISDLKALATDTVEKWLLWAHFKEIKHFDIFGKQAPLYSCFPKVEQRKLHYLTIYDWELL